MRLYTAPGFLTSIAFQTHPTLLQVFLRYRFGRRHFSLVRSLLVPLAIALLALGLRIALPHRIIYAPLRVLPPYNGFPENQALITSTESGLHGADFLFFLGFAALFLLVSLAHYIHLSISRWRKTDPTNTRFWGNSVLNRIPLLRRLPLRVVQGVVEPALFLLGGYALCALAPLFGVYLMAGAIVLAIEQNSTWRTKAKSELDARDALMAAESQRSTHETAQEHLARAHQAHAISAKTLARVQSNPHALLALGPEETSAVCNELGNERFGALIDRLEPEAQQAVYGHLVGLQSVPEVQPKTRLEDAPASRPGRRTHGS